MKLILQSYSNPFICDQPVSIGKWYKLIEIYVWMGKESRQCAFIIPLSYFSLNEIDKEINLNIFENETVGSTIG